MARSNMTRNDWLRFGTVIVVAVVALYLLYPFWPLNKVVKLGLDLQGGVRLVLEAEGVADMTPADQTKTIDQVITILSNRIDQYGLANAEIRRFGGERILINLPGAADPEEARRLIGQTALLEFRRVIQAGSSPLDDLVPTSIDQEVLYDRDGRPYIVERDPLLTGNALSNAVVRTSQSLQTIGQLYIALSFTQEGAEQFAKIMRQMNVNDLLAIVLDRIRRRSPAGSTRTRRRSWRSPSAPVPSRPRSRSWRRRASARRSGTTRSGAG